jgi:hypothetical protein
MSPLGYSPPVQPVRSQNAWLSRYSFLRPCSKTRLLEHSSPGVRLPFTVCPEAPRFRHWPQEPARKATPLGFVAPSAHEETRVHVSVRCCRLPGVAGRAPRPFSLSVRTREGLSDRESASGSHSASYGAAPRFSKPLSGFLPLTSAPPFSDGWRSWGYALQGFAPLTKPRQLVAAGLPS